MKRMTLIAIALCALLLTTLGAGVVTAKQEVKAPQANTVAKFDVTYGGKVVGTLTVNTKQLTYAFNGHGLTAGTTYYLKCSAFLRGVSSAQATPDGTVRMQGACDQWLGVLAARPSFELSTEPPVVQDAFFFTPKLTAYYKIPMTGLKVWGRLTDGKLTDGVNEYPIADAVINILTWDNHWGTYVLTDKKVTDSNGAYSYSTPGVPLGDAATHPPLVQSSITYGGAYYDMASQTWYDLYWSEAHTYASKG